MIQLEKALARAGIYPVRTGSETLPLEDTPGRVLAEDIFADRDIPPFPRSTMDGYACRRKDLPGPLVVLETIEAGKLPVHDIGRGRCSKIMTGAMVPSGADCVIMKEDVETGTDGRILFTAVETEAHIDSRGQDLKKGELLLPQGCCLTPGHLGIIASAGKTRIKVARALKVGILATGSELIEAGQHPEGAQIRNSNSYQLAAQIRRAGHLPYAMGIVEDRFESIAERITMALEGTDLLLLTGGASVGELDLVPGVLKELGFRLEFDRVAMQPGKPVSFAHRENKRCFGLSGNPVSSFVQFELLVRPYLEICAGMLPVNKRILVTLEKEYRRKQADRQFFLPVTFTGGGACEAVEYHGSGHLHALEKATGFAEIPAGQKIVNKGDKVHVRLI
ncbi:MAG: molybdopterin molybdotransferase MoeA [Bacteroidales bacterium]|nr:molybdopterin molybdotransferase MoeA [Bacteroidales bacterium]